MKDKFQIVDVKIKEGTCNHITFDIVYTDVEEVAESVTYHITDFDSELEFENHDVFYFIKEQKAKENCITKHDFIKLTGKIKR